MEKIIVVGDKVRALSGKFKGQEGVVVDVYDKPDARVRVKFLDNSLEIYDYTEVEITHKEFNFNRLVKSL